MSNELKERLIDWLVMAVIAIGVTSGAYLIYRTELLYSCVDAKNISGKLYSEIKECDYIFKGLESKEV